MKTPVIDFVKEYINKDISRFHMPGHKGQGILGIEKFDITEIQGADDLGCPDGIIKESEENASELFGSAHSFYVTGGSTTAICAMLSLVDNDGVVLAARNVHKAFVHACALLDLDVDWIFPKVFSSVVECKINGEDVRQAVENSKKKISAVYLTSPDYLGNIQDIRGIADVCGEYGIPLLVDNAHGAYLKFLDNSMHPLDLGAAMCCDSAHKTLPVLTGGAYLHISKDADKSYVENGRRKISLFSSTSPSYLILQSLDKCNNYIDTVFRTELSECVESVKEIVSYINSKGFFAYCNEPLKVVIDAKKSGYSGYEMADFLRNGLIEPEFADEDYVVLMVTPKNRAGDFERLKNVFSENIPGKEIEKEIFNPVKPERVLSVRDGVLSENEYVNAENALGRICGDVTVSCPPAVPVVVSGERITEESIRLFKYYKIQKIQVVKKEENNEKSGN